MNLFFRWASIGNMIQFTNAVYGTAVGNWVAGSDMLAFSRSVELTNAVYGTVVGNGVAGSDILAFSRPVELTNNM